MLPTVLKMTFGKLLAAWINKSSAVTSNTFFSALIAVKNLTASFVFPSNVNPLKTLISFSLAFNVNADFKANL